MNKLLLFFLFWFSSLLLLSACEAAQAPSEVACAHQTREITALIADTPIIMLATAEGDERDSVTRRPLDEASLKEIQKLSREDQSAGDRNFGTGLPVQLFIINEYLKGSGASRMSVVYGRAETPVNRPENFHDSKAFWDDAQAGRAKLQSDCRIVTTFQPGAQYLVFLGGDHVKAYEEIKRSDDRWLDYVRSEIAN